MGKRSPIFRQGAPVKKQATLSSFFLASPAPKTSATTTITTSLPFTPLGTTQSVPRVVTPSSVAEGVETLPFQYKGTDFVSQVLDEAVKFVERMMNEQFVILDNTSRYLDNVNLSYFHMDKKTFFLYAWQYDPILNRWKIGATGNGQKRTLASIEYQETPPIGVMDIDNMSEATDTLYQTETERICLKFGLDDLPSSMEQVYNIGDHFALRIIMTGINIRQCGEKFGGLGAVVGVKKRLGMHLLESGMTKKDGLLGQRGSRIELFKPEPIRAVRDTLQVVEDSVQDCMDRLYQKYSYLYGAEEFNYILSTLFTFAVASWPVDLHDLHWGGEILIVERIVGIGNWINIFHDFPGTGKDRYNKNLYTTPQRLQAYWKFVSWLDDLIRQLIHFVILVDTNDLAFGAMGTTARQYLEGQGWEEVIVFGNVTVLVLQNGDREPIFNKIVVRIIFLHRPFCYMICSPEETGIHNQLEAMGNRATEGQFILYSFVELTRKKQYGMEDGIFGHNLVLGHYVFRYAIANLHLKLKVAGLIFKEILLPNNVNAFEPGKHGLLLDPRVTGIARWLRQKQQRSLVDVQCNNENIDGVDCTDDASDSTEDEKIQRDNFVFKRSVCRLLLARNLAEVEEAAGDVIMMLRDGAGSGYSYRYKKMIGGNEILLPGILRDALIRHHEDTRNNSGGSAEVTRNPTKNQRVAEMSDADQFFQAMINANKWFWIADVSDDKARTNGVVVLQPGDVVRDAKGYRVYFKGDRTPLIYLGEDDDDDDENVSSNRFPFCDHMVWDGGLKRRLDPNKKSSKKTGAATVELDLTSYEAKFYLFGLDSSNRHNCQKVKNRRLVRLVKKSVSS